MVPPWTYSRGNNLPGTHGDLWHNMEFPPMDQYASRHQECLRHACSWIRWSHSMGHLHVSWSFLELLADDRFTGEMATPSAALLAAAFIGIVPGYISRSVAGSYDNEAIAIFLLMFTFYLWIKAVKTGSATYGTLTALFYGWMVAAWGGYVFITNSTSSYRT
jgi:hypothetical protein